MHIRRNPRRRLLIGAVAAAAATALSVPAVSAFADDDDASATQDYELTELPVPDGYDGGSVMAVSPSGEYVAGAAHDGNLYVPLLWHDGEVEEIEVPEAVTALPMAVDSSGKVAGTFNRSSEDTHILFFYEDGEVEVWEEDENFTLNDLNDEGVWSGSYSDDDNDVHPAVWPEGDDEPELFEMPDGWSSGHAVGTNADRVVAGYFAAGGQGLSYPAMWDADGTLTELTLPEELDDLDQEVSLRVDAASGDWIVGHVADTPGVHGTVLWNVADGDAPGELLPSAGLWRDVSSDGWTVGAGDDGPAVHADGEVVELPGIRDEHTIHDRATAISDEGHVVGGVVRDEDERAVPTLWTVSG